MVKSKILHQINFDITEKWLRSCNCYQRMFTRIDLTPEQILEIFLSDVDNDLLLRSLSGGFDTGEREEFMSLLSEKLIGLYWPCNAESGDKKFKGFYDSLEKAAVEAGYSVKGKEIKEGDEYFHEECLYPDW